MSKDTVTASGKRKSAIARASVKKGKGKVRINNVLLDMVEPEIFRMKVREPLIIAGKLSDEIDIDISVAGGGVSSQADAVRLAIARALIKYTKDSKLEERFQEYDRHLLVADVRRKEVRKPNTNSKARAKKQKSYR